MSVFKSKEKLLPSHIPDKMPHREEKFKELLDYFNQVIKNEINYTHVFIIGNTGTGKTLVARRFESTINEKNIEDIITIYVNARIERIPGNIVRQMIKRVSPYLPIRGYSVEEMYLHMLLSVLESGKKILLILDDADHIFEKYPEFIYKLSRVEELLENKPNPLSILFILHNKYALSRLDSWTLAGLRKNILYFEDYDYDELVDILSFRAQEAFNEGAIEDSAIEAAADIASVYTYNARYGIELLLRAGEIVDKKGENVVKAEHVRMARFEVPPSFSYDDIASLRLHEKILLYALAEKLSSEDRSFVTTGELERRYREISFYFNVDPAGHTWFWKMIDTLSSFGIVSKRIVSKDIRGRTTLIGLPSFSASMLLNKLKEMITNEINKYKEYQL
ncbi:hypothetical protein DRN84_00125 [Candidatus Geothermarchaeota archaeon]|nr:MAG: hypothetical protein DRN87_05040 [Candidatus Geothermarchaeota archaeon]RLG63091.1 MAG: hypothetical protein DRN84_00125 [Candidatus Geothermarchaeota archaeon]HEW93393.1 hypothetical protein [Thermoprotei archaeon]